MKQTGISSIFGLIPSLFNKVDVNVINRYNQAIQDGCNHEQAYQAALTDTSGAMIKCNGATQDAISAANGQSISLSKLTLKSKAAALGMKALNWAMSTLVMVGVSWAISSIANAIQEYQANLEKARQETIEAGKLADETNDKLQEYIATYHQLAKTGGSADQLKDLQQQIADLVGVQANNLDLVNGKLDDELEKLRQISIEQAQNNKGDLTGALVSAEQALEATKGSGAYSGYSHRFFKIDDSLLNNSGFMSLLDSLGVAQKYSNTGEFTGSFTFAQDSAENLYKSYQACVQAVTYMKDNMEPELLKESALYNDLTAQIGKYSEAAKTYGNALDAYNQNEAIIAVGKNLKTFSGEINDQKSFDNWVESIINAEGATGDYADAIWEVCESRYPQFKKQTDEVVSSVQGAEDSFKSIAKTLSDGLDKLNDKKDILSKVKDQLDSFGAISADNISKILSEFSDNDDVQQAVAYYLSGIDTAQHLYDVMAQGYQNDLKLQAQNLAIKMQNDKQYYEKIGGLDKDFTDWLSSNYSVDLQNCNSLAATKLEVEKNLITKLKTNWSGYYRAQSDNLAMIQGQASAVWYDYRRWGNPNSESYKQAKANWELATEAYRQYLKMEERLNNLTLTSFNASGFNSSLSTKFDGNKSGKTEAEKHFDKLKYRLETNQITQEKYLKDLDWGYKHFYNKTAEYLENYAKYSQEVYDGFKDMYKDDLNAQKDAWEEKKKAVSDYYDKLRKQIEDARDKEDYEKEQTEKRKELFDLDMKIAELMRDGSEKAKARIAELEEERLKAEEELRDFETDNARENELKRLEKEQEAEEAKIQAEIDKIDTDLKTIDDDIVGVRKTIIDYAKKKGVTLDFAYASGTRRSVGGFGRINENGLEMISAPDGNGNYINLMPNSYVFSAKATEFLWKLATEHSLPQAMYNSIAKSIQTQRNTPSVNIAQPINITMGDIIIQGNADDKTVANIKKQEDNMVRTVLQKIKELQK